MVEGTIRRGPPAAKGAGGEVDRGRCRHRAIARPHPGGAQRRLGPAGARSATVWATRCSATRRPAARVRL